MLIVAAANKLLVFKMKLAGDALGLASPKELVGHSYQTF